jgi:broad specificity phosphatase PhoE
MRCLVPSSGAVDYVNFCWPRQDGYAWLHLSVWPAVCGSGVWAALPRLSGMRLLLIRHGQTPCNVAGELDTAVPGAPLTGLGQVQAGAVPAALAEEGIGGIYASTLVRTQLTAAPLARARGLKVQVRAGLEEISAGALEMRGDQQARQAYASCLAAWMHGELDRAMPGGADGHEFKGRFHRAVRQIAGCHDPGDTVAVFSHGAAIRVYTALHAGIPAGEATRLEIMNTGAAALQGSPGTGWDLARWHREPLGGLGLEDPAAQDVTGESAKEVLEPAGDS